jgi:hypothetical protein
MLSNQAERLIEGLPRDPRIDAYTEELLRDRSLTPAQRDALLVRKIEELYPSWHLTAEVDLIKAEPEKLADDRTEKIVGEERTVERAIALGTGESLVVQLESGVNQAEQLRDQQVQQQYADQFGVYVQTTAEQIERLQSSLVAALSSEQTQLQVLTQTPPGWTAGKKAHAQWDQQLARRQTRIAQLTQRLDRVGEIAEGAGIYAEKKMEELAERKLRFGQPELAQEWDKIRRKERQASIPRTQNESSIQQDLGRSLTLSRTPEDAYRA